VSVVFDGDMDAKYAESAKDKKRAAARTALAVLMMNTLSTDELVEYRTAFLDRDERLHGDPGDVLHHLFLTGVVSLDMIKNARKALQIKAEQEWIMEQAEQAEKAAKAGK
jgi:ArsR family metal-binding transcriptional regulator